MLSEDQELKQILHYQELQHKPHLEDPESKQNLKTNKLLKIMLSEDQELKPILLPNKQL